MGRVYLWLGVGFELPSKAPSPLLWALVPLHVVASLEMCHRTFGRTFEMIWSSLLPILKKVKVWNIDGKRIV